MIQITKNFYFPLHYIAEKADFSDFLPNLNPIGFIAITHRIIRIKHSFARLY